MLLLAPFTSKLANHSRHGDTLKFRKNSKFWYFPSKTSILLFSNIFQRLTLPQKIYQFGRKRCQKRRRDVSYQLLWEFFQKYFVLHEREAVKDLFSIYICTKGFYSCGVNLTVTIANRSNSGSIGLTRLAVIRT